MAVLPFANVVCYLEVVIKADFSGDDVEQLG